MADILMDSGQVQKNENTRPVRVELFLDTDTYDSYGELHIHGMYSFSRYYISRDLVVTEGPEANSKILARGITQSNGFWNFILADTREPFSATGFIDLYDAEFELLKYFVLKYCSYPMAVSPQRAAYFPDD